MTQHIYRTATALGIEVEILAGYDRPLGGYFLVVSATGAGGGEPAQLYSNLDDPALSDEGGLAPQWDYFGEILSRLHLAVPRAMCEQIEADGAANRGNRVVEYDAAGRIALDTLAGSAQ